MSIRFSVVRWKNFLSTGNAFTEVKLDQHKSTLIVGENGAGKSTILDAICFALYGKPFRKINKPQLLNSLNKKGLEVEIEFRSNNKDYLVRRGIKPAIFEIFCNGELLNQDAAARDYQEYLESTILKLSYKSFGQVVVLGSSTFIPFMQLSAKDRREVIEDLLDIEIFTTMNSLLKEHVSENKEKVQDSKYQIELYETQIQSAEEHNESIRQLREEEVAKLKEKIRVKVQYAEEQKTLAEGIDVEINDLIAQIIDKASVKKKHTDAQALNRDFENKLKALEKEVAFYHDHDNCPTCKQEIDPDFKHSHVTDYEERKVKILNAKDQLAQKLKEYNNRIDEISDIEDQVAAKTLERGEHNANVKLTVGSLKEIKKELEEAEQEAKAVDTSHVEQLRSALVEEKKAYQDLLSRREMLSVVSTMLKDGGIKTRIIKQYVPIMNTLVNKYLAAMDFFVQFELDENFNETIKSRFRDVFSYASFSEGEKLRIDLALMFTWRAVSKLRNSVSTNLLIMDEIMDSSLDAAGTEEFLKIINDLTEDSNVFIISHKGDQLLEKFENTIKFEKHKNFSRMAA